MSAVLFLKKSLSKLPPSVARQVVGCCYHTEKGVYGYRPKLTESNHKLGDRIAALNQGQYGVNLLCAQFNITQKEEEELK